jgi:hypothetical protein
MEKLIILKKFKYYCKLFDQFKKKSNVFDPNINDIDSENPLFLFAA